MLLGVWRSDLENGAARRLIENLQSRIQESLVMIPSAPRRPLHANSRVPRSMQNASSTSFTSIVRQPFLRQEIHLPSTPRSYPRKSYKALYATLACIHRTTLLSRDVGQRELDDCFGNSHQVPKRHVVQAIAVQLEDARGSNPLCIIRAPSFLMAVARIAHPR